MKLERRYPSWWRRYCPGTRILWWEDTISLRSQSDEEMVQVLNYFNKDPAMNDYLTELYHSYHIVDTTRPVELRTLDLSDPSILETQMKKLLTAAWSKIQPQIQQLMAYLPDPWVLELGLEHAAIDWTVPMNLQVFQSLCRAVFLDAAIIRLTTLVAEQDRQTDFYEKIANEKAQSEAKAKAKALEEEKEAELLRLKETNPVEYALVMREKAVAEAEAKEEEKEELKRKKKEKKLKEKKEWALLMKEQKELNALAETDPEEFEKRNALVEAKIQAYKERLELREKQKERKKQDH